MSDHSQANVAVQYREVMDLDQPAAAKREQSKRWLALERAHDIRKFEIDLYWKRATYFFLVQAAVFTGIGFALPGRTSAGEPAFVLVLACLGLLCAASSYKVAVGSRFWQRNWERHIDYLEAEFEGHLYKAVWFDSGDVSWSVTRVNQSLAQAFVALWIGIIVAALGWIAVSGKGSSLSCDKDTLDPLLTFRFIAVLVVIPITCWLHKKIQGSVSEVDGVGFEIIGEERKLKIREPRTLSD